MIAAVFSLATEIAIAIANKSRHSVHSVLNPTPAGIDPVSLFSSRAKPQMIREFPPLLQWKERTLNSGCLKRGVEFKGMMVSAVLTVLAVLESTLPSFCLSYKLQQNEATAAVSAVMAVSVMMATPLNSTPLSL